MPSPIVRLILAASLIVAASDVSAQAAPACFPRDIASLSSAQVALLKRASLDPIVGCPALDAAHRVGDVLIGPRDTVKGNLVALDGSLHIAGVVTGSAIAINGAVIIDSSGHVLGDVVSAEHGAAIAPSGRIDGELRTLDALAPMPTGEIATANIDTFTSLKHTAAWFGILIILAIGVLTNAGDAMQRVTSTLNAGFGRNVTVGVMAQLALLPVLVTICLLLCLTLIGILLVPFAIVAYVVAVLGLVVLGGLGAVQMVGKGIAARRPGQTERGARLQALVSGMLMLSVPWLLAASLTSWPVASAAIRTIALGITWVAITAGLGAALRTRGGTRSHEEPWGLRRPAPSGTPRPVTPPTADWLTPTPITGVVAVKRPTTTTGGAR
ncbi:MAG: polymer-forming cytoskeletal protein [Gemmatimonadaceae bacterium]|nr:polymer-forming cytoskeletal protein [Gemmatimonadaceae bacterium]